MRRPLLPGIALCLLLCCGCDENVYELRMAIAGGSLDRELTCWREDPADKKEPLRVFPAEEMNRLAAIYGTRPKGAEDKRKHTFRGTFVGSTPSDIGGAGFSRQLTTAFGALTCYSERFRGDDDLLRSLERPQRACDQLIDLVTGWLETELGNVDGWTQLRAFMTTQLRHDLKNAVLCAALPTLREQTSSDTEQNGAQEKRDFVELARAAQYLVERDYLTPEQVPDMVNLAVRAHYRRTDDVRSRLSQLLDSMLRRTAALPEQAPVLAALADFVESGDVKASFDAYVKTTDAWREHQRKWHENPPQDDSAGPQPIEVLEAINDDLLKSILSEGASGRLTAALNCPAQPCLTNGRWDAEQGVVVWQVSLHGARRLPALAYAVWAEANEPFQKEHFGDVILQGDKLAQYVVWRAGLDADKAREWDEFVAGLKPQDSPVTQLEQFLFEDERERPVPPEERLAYSLANPGRGLLLETLQPPEGVPPE